MQKIEGIYETFERYLGSPEGDILFLSTIAAMLSSEFAAQWITQQEALGWIYDNYSVALELHNYLKNFSCSKVESLSNMPSYFRKELLERRDDYFFLACNGRTARSENVDLLFELLETGHYQGDRLQSLVVLGFEGLVPPDFQGRVFAVPITLRPKYTQEFAETVNEWREILIHYCLKNFAVIQRQLKACRQKDWKEAEHLWLYASASILYLMIEDFDQKEVGNWRGRIKRNISLAIEKSDNLQDNEEIPELVVDAIYDYARHCSGMKERKSVIFNESDLQNLSLYDDEYYYFSEKVFSEICSSLTQMVSYRQIKNALFETGHLCQDKGERRYGTCKVTIKTETGCRRARFCKLRRDRVDRTGHLPLFMVYEQEEQKKNEERRRIIRVVHRQDPRRTKGVSGRK